MKTAILLCGSLCFGGTFLRLSAGAAPSNDYFTNSIHLEGTNVAATADLTGATREPGEPQHPSYGPMTGESAWWSWVTPETGRADIIGIDFWSVGLGVYTGPDLDHLGRVYSGWYGSFTAEAGTVYHIALERRVNGNPVVNFTVKVTPYATNSPNDNFADAAPLGFRAANLAATREPGEPAHRAGGPNKSLWWRWAVPCNSSVWVGGQTGTLPDVTVVAYTGVSVESLTPVARGTATNAFYFNATGGVTYYIAAETAADANGEIQLDGGAGTPDGRVVGVPGNLVQNSSFETL
ncbi:MAG TPA: hypothetical protein VJA21_03105, partial [Verrucomicrobiae bacterium]